MVSSDNRANNRCSVPTRLAPICWAKRAARAKISRNFGELGRYASLAVFCMVPYPV